MKRFLLVGSFPLLAACAPPLGDMESIGVVYSVEAEVDIGYVASGTTGAGEFSLPGVAVSDAVFCSPLGDVLGPLVYSHAYVSAPGVVSVVVGNLSGQDGDPQPFTVKCAVVR